MIKNITKLVNDYEFELDNIYKNIDKICEYNSLKVLNAFHKNKVSTTHFNSTTGYGYDDIGREVIESIYSDIFNTDDALVRCQINSGTHALKIALFAMLRPNDILLSITGMPYDTLHEVIGIVDNESSLKSYNVKYRQIDLVDNDFNIDKIKKAIVKDKIKLITIQRGKGYEDRESISIKKIENVIKEIRKVDKDVIIMIDNCYCEFVSVKEPSDVGADLVVGSLIKNLGGGIASNGGYIVGKKKLIELCANELNVPGQGKEVGPTINQNRSILLGLYMAPNAVKNSLKIAVLTSKVMDSLGYIVNPKYDDERSDIVQTITFNDKKKLINYCNSIQNSSPIDSNVVVEPSDMPGYSDKIIMASGSFTMGSSIELSCDGPIRKPYIAFQQGSLTYEYGKIALIKAISNLDKE